MFFNTLLGAMKVCEALDDEFCFGDYYQWGRRADGHEKYGSDVTTTLAIDINNTHAYFIIQNNISPYDWTTVDTDGFLRSTQWSRIDGNSICPIGYRVPTIQELEDEIIYINNSIDAFNSFLKLPSSGSRYGYDGSYRYESMSGHLWSSSIHHEGAYNLHYYSILSYTGSNGRANAYAVRCIKE